jgi:ATP-dependent exoDNAse (exonuclease V) beta subunit
MSHGLDIHNGEWLMLARNRNLLDIYKQLLRDEGIVFMEGEFVYMESLFTMIQNWEKLRRGEELSGENVRNLYQKALQDNVEFGRRTFKFTPGQFYSWQYLKENHGLLTDAPWFEAFDRVPAADRQYVQLCLSNGETPKAPRVRVMTIHSSKGREADNVALLSDMSRASHDELYTNPDNEHRVFYVGASRARQKLFLITPEGENHYGF